MRRILSHPFATHRLVPLNGANLPANTLQKSEGMLTFFATDPLRVRPHERPESGPHAAAVGRTSPAAITSKLLWPLVAAWVA